MMDQNRDQTMLKEQPQMGPPRTEDIVAASEQRNADAIQAPAPPPLSKPVAATTVRAPLLPAHDLEGLRAKWTDIQAGFVDEPRESVEHADTLVVGVLKSVAESFANERSKLEGQWSRGDNVSTEDLRVALQHYRAFFDRLLSL